MFGVVITLFSAAVFAGSAVWGISAGLVGAGGVLGVYAVVLLADLLCFQTERPGGLPLTEELRSSLARSLRERLQGFVMRAEAFEWQGAQVEVLGAGVRRDPLFRELITSGAWRSEGSKALAAQAVRYLRARSRSGAVAVHVWDQSTASTALLGVDGERFKSLLERYGAVVAQGGLISAEDGAFQQFGFPQVLMRGVRMPELGGVVLWAGYPQQIAVTSLEERFLVELSEALSDEMRYSSELMKVAAPSALQQKPAMLEQFSHDIRSPLSNVKAILSLLRVEELRAETAQLVEVALSNCRGVEAVVEDVIDLSRVRAGVMVRRTEIVELAPLVEEVVEGFRVTARMRGLELAFRCPSERLVIRGDKNQLRRVITNLVSNALKYTKFGTVSVSLRRGAGEVIEVVVADTGVGMSQEQLGKLFEPFTRFHGEEIEGVGLGLSIVKLLVEQNAGTIAVESSPDRGSVFVLSFAEVLCEESKSEQRATVVGAARKRRILIVDDDLDSVQSLSKLLARDGHEVLPAVTVHDALSIVNFDPPEIVITDAAMPGGGGRRILQFIQSGRREIPVVFLSGNITNEQELRALGAAAVLEKPCDIAALRGILAGFDSVEDARALG